MMAQLLTDYRRGRNVYRLPATAAYRYALDCAAVVAWTADGDDDRWWTAEPDADEPGALTVQMGANDAGGPYDIYDACGGVDTPYTVSDHGNVHYDDADPYLVGIVAGMVADLAWADADYPTARVLP